VSQCRALVLNVQCTLNRNESELYYVWISELELTIIIIMIIYSSQFSIQSTEYELINGDCL